MECLNSREDNLKTIDEKNIKYLNIQKHPELLYGKISFTSSNVTFNRFSKTIIDNLNNQETITSKIYNISPSCRIRFKTNSPRVIIKVEKDNNIQKKYDEYKNSLDIYEIEQDKYIPKSTIKIENGNNIFAEEVNTKNNGKISIFLPNLEIIENMYIGIEENCEIERLDYLGENRIPIIICGNEHTMGFETTKNSNNLANLISKYMDQEVIDLSYYGCTVADMNIAEIIGKINCYSIVIDYNQNISDYKRFQESISEFYKKIREYHPDINIIIITSSIYNTENENMMIDELINEIHTIKYDNNTHIIKKEYDKNVILNNHNINKYNYELVEEICNLFKMYL